MRRAAAVIACLAAFAAGGAAAFAKAPKASDAPTVEEIYQQAVQAQADIAKRAAEASRDPMKEQIDAYRSDRKKVQFTDYQPLVDILLNAKDDKVQPYRRDAANALIVRFQREDDGDPMVRATRREVALKLLILMKAPPKDTIGLGAIEDILLAWWKGKIINDVKFKGVDKPDDRKKAYDKMKKFLEKDSG